MRSWRNKKMSWNKYKTISLILGLLITTPIWYYLIYVLLKSADVDRLVWFLYIVYVPISILNTIIAKIGEDD